MGKISLREIMSEITRRRTPGEKIFSNFFPGESLDTEYDVLYGQKTVVFWKDKEDVTRVYFHSSKLEELVDLLKKTPNNTVLDYICQEGDEPAEAIEAGGYKKYAVYVKKQWRAEEVEVVPAGGTARLLYDMYQPECGEYAKEQDVLQIYELLLQNFDMKADHIFSKDELIQMVKKKEIMVYKIGAKIESFFIYRREGKKLYCAFSYNNASADILYSLERRVKEIEYREHGITINYAWFNAENKKALRRNSWPDTGIRDYIFIK